MYLTRERKAEIEATAFELLSNFEKSDGQLPILPVRVEEIVETFLKIPLSFVDLHEAYHSEVWGVLNDDHTISVDTRLDPIEYPNMIAKYRFTLGHEIGHYCLHNGMTRKQAMYADFVETEADWFSASLLMPPSLVKKAWYRFFGAPPCGLLLLYACKRITSRGIASRQEPDFIERQVHFAGREMAKELSVLFEVSADAMRIQLENLGLLDYTSFLDQHSFILQDYLHRRSA